MIRVIVLLLGFSIIVFSCKDPSDKKQSKEKAVEQSFSQEKLIDLANKAYDQDDYLLSIEYFSTLIDLDSSVGEYFYKRAYSYAQIDSVEKSSNDYLTAANLEYRKVDAFYNLGLNYTIFFNDTMALKYLNKALELNPDDTDIINEIKACKKRLEQGSNKNLSI